MKISKILNNRLKRHASKTSKKLLEYIEIQKLRLVYTAEHDMRTKSQQTLRHYILYTITWFCVIFFVNELCSITGYVNILKIKVNSKIIKLLATPSFID